jgi:hypothetical protein
MGASTVTGSGVVQITNSTLTGNTAQGGTARDLSATFGGSGYGGAIFNLDGAITLNEATVAFNTVAGQDGGSADGGAVYNLADGNNIQTGGAVSATVTLNNSILSDTTGGTDLAGQIKGSNNASVGSSANANLVMSKNLGSTPIVGTVITVTNDPQLSGLFDNGGPTQTLEPELFGPAFGAGNANTSGLPSNDQRGPGFARVVNFRLDLGALELQFPPTVTPTPTPPPAALPLPPPISVAVVGSRLLVLSTATGGVLLSVPLFFGNQRLVGAAVVLDADGLPGLLLTLRDKHSHKLSVVRVDGNVLVRLLQAWADLPSGGVVAILAGDGFLQFLVGTEAGGVPAVAVYSGSAGTLLRQLNPFPARHAGGGVARVSLREQGGVPVLVVSAAGQPTILLDARSLLSRRLVRFGNTSA